MELSIVLPAYSEALNLQNLLPQITEAIATLDIPYEVLVVDTIEPTDNTREICDSFPVCRYLARTGGNNYGDAIRTGFSQAQGNRIVVMDADGSHNPKDVLRLYEEAEKGCDVVIGSRYINGGNSHNGFILKFMSKIVNMVYRVLFRIKAKDVSNSFRIYSAEKLKKIPLHCNNFDIVEEILILFEVYYPAFKLVEIPVFFDRRKHGESKRNLVRFAFSYIGTITRMIKIKRDARSNRVSV